MSATVTIMNGLQIVYSTEVTTVEKARTLLGLIAKSYREAGCEIEKARNSDDIEITKGDLYLTAHID